MIGTLAEIWWIFIIHILIFAACGVLLLLLNAVCWSRELYEILCHGAGGQLVSLLLHLDELHPLRISAHLHLEGLGASARGAAQDLKLFWRLSRCAAEKWKAVFEPR